MKKYEEIKWDRRWYELTDSESEPIKQEGFLPDPDEFFLSYDKRVVSFKEIDNRNCLILLGPPGIGKSTWLKQHYEEKLNSIKKDEIIYELIDLKVETDIIPKINDVFNSSIYTDWKENNKILYLYMDSIDEGRLFQNRLIIFLAQKLNELNPNQIDRLRLRLISRHADWNEGDTNLLERCFLIDEGKTEKKLNGIKGLVNYDTMCWDVLTQ